MTSRLYLEFCGEDHTMGVGESLTFGRAGDLVIDENPYLHRVVGRFVDRGGVWWLENHGRASTLAVRDLGGPSTSTIAPRSALALVHGEFSCSFSAGPTRYEVIGALEGHEWATDLLGPDGLAGQTTLEWGRVGLNDDQRLLLLAMCEHRLLDPGASASEMPTNRQGAARLGWTLTKFNRKLDHLCEKLHRAGLADVHGEIGANAADRRRRVVDHAIVARLVTADELPLIDRARAA